MSVIRSSDKYLPKRDKLCHILAKMLNNSISVETKRALAESFFNLTTGITPVEAILTEYQLTGRMVSEDHMLALEIDVPAEYVDPTLNLKPEDMKLRFIITRYTNLDNAQSHQIEKNTNE